MIWTIPPAFSDSPAFLQETALDGTTYRLTFRWNARAGYWYLDLEDIDGVSIVAGRKLVPGAALLRYVTDSRRPPGELLVLGTPDENDLGVGGVLVYADEDE